MDLVGSRWVQLGGHQRLCKALETPLGTRRARNAALQGNRWGNRWLYPQPLVDFILLRLQGFR
jgi:hypothetical protein